MLRPMYGLSRGFGWFDAEALDGSGVGHTGEERHECPQPDRDDREARRPPPAVVEEQGGHRHRDHDHEVDRRELSGHVGVTGTPDDTTLGEQQVVAIEEVVARLDQRDRRHQGRHVGVRRRGHDQPWSPQTDAAVHVVRRRGQQRGDHDRPDKPVRYEGQERELEDVEPDVVTELGIIGAEADPVTEQQPVVPLRCRRHTEESRGNHHDDSAHEPAVALDDAMDPTERFLLCDRGAATRGATRSTSARLP